jgi:hypothetical protein
MGLATLDSPNRVKHRQSPRRGLGRLCHLYDRFYGWWHRLRDIPAPGGAYLRMQRARYRGRPIRLPDGTRLCRSQRVLLLHLNSRRLECLAQELVSPGRTGIAFRRLVCEGLETLADLFERDPALADVRAVGAFTTFWAGSQRFGFVVVPLKPGWWARIVGAYQLTLTRQHALPRSTWPPRRWAHGPAEARAIWISTAALCRRFGARGRVDPPHGSERRRAGPSPRARLPTPGAADLRRAGPR